MHVFSEDSEPVFTETRADGAERRVRCCENVEPEGLPLQAENGDPATRLLPQ